jgi:hypothetical protein
MGDSMTSATGGGYLNAGILNGPVQQVSQRYQIIHGYYNAGAYYGFWIANPTPEHDSRGISATRQRICYVLHLLI